MPLLPTAADLKKEILAAVTDSEAARPAHGDTLKDRIEQEHVTLEVFCSMLRYRCRRFDVLELWDELCTDIGVNSLSACIAELRRAGWVGTILTTNFDRMIQEALEGQDYCVLTERQRQSDRDPRVGDVCALHGTTYKGIDPAGEKDFAPPVSAMARGLARPYPPALYGYLSRLHRSGTPILVIGHSGRDYYDMNPLLSELRTSRPEGLGNWLWLSYSGAVDEMERLGNLVGDGNVVAAQADKVLPKVCESLGLHPRPRNDSGPEAWKRRLRRTIAAFDLEPEGVRQFVKDLQVNLPGAWVVQEHYRLYSAGYDEGDTLTFGGVALRGVEEALEADISHLDFLDPPFRVPYGDLLKGQFAYRHEDARYVASPGDSGDGYSYPLTKPLFEETARRIDESLSHPGAGTLRPEDRALLLVGKAIATDYLGLIQRKGWQFLGEAGADLRKLSVESFRACIELAQKAARELESLRAAPGGDPDAFDDLVQHRVWEMIGTDNVPRSLDRAEAIPAFRKAIALRQDLIRRERAQREGDHAGGTMNDYLIAHYPMLWLRASELVKVLLYAEGNTAVPQPIENLPESERREVDDVLKVCRDAYEAYRRVTGRVHHSFPAYFEAQIVAWAARALSSGSQPERSQALAEMDSALDRFRAVTGQSMSVSSPWVENVETRVEAIRRALKETDGRAETPDGRREYRP